ncbi:unnamed protein product [Pleuronectes platessa]|uniref:Uncharacterized protein n=1 Tax=Pleuronectes platessa TaxID=8262 RepID=A0A9N7U1X6_PLEPL|nr:unnamed protein product [Pleuronectes platessa]
MNLLLPPAPAPPPPPAPAPPPPPPPAPCSCSCPPLLIKRQEAVCRARSGLRGADSCSEESPPGEEKFEGGVLWFNRTQMKQQRLEPEENIRTGAASDVTIISPLHTFVMH